MPSHFSLNGPPKIYKIVFSFDEEIEKGQLKAGNESLGDWVQSASSDFLLAAKADGVVDIWLPMQKHTNTRIMAIKVVNPGAFLYQSCRVRGLKHVGKS